MLASIKTNRIKLFVSVAIGALLILAVSVTLWYFSNSIMFSGNKYPRIAMENGVWDLRERVADGDDIFFLNNINEQLIYTPDALLSPEEFDEYEGEIRTGSISKKLRVATSKQIILLPDDDDVWMLTFRSNDYNEKIYINGQLRQAAGKPGLTPEESEPGAACFYFEVQAVDGAIELVRQSSNFVHAESGGLDAVTIGRPERVKQLVSQRMMFPAISMGLYLCLFVLHMLLFLLIQGYRPNLWFSLLCVVWLVRTGFSGWKVLWSLFPSIPWSPAYRMLNISIAITCILILMLVDDEFPSSLHKWAKRGLIAAFSMFTVFYLIADTLIISRAKIGCEVLAILTGVYVLLRLIMTAPGKLRERKLHMEQLITLTGIVFVFFGCFLDVLYYANIHVITYSVSEITLLVFVMLQMLAMVCGTMRQLNVARQDAQIAWESAELLRKKERLALLRAESAEKDLELHKQLISEIPPESLLTLGELTLNLVSNQAYYKDEDIILAPKEFSLLYVFMCNENKTIRRAELHEKAWGQPIAPKDRALDSSVYRLRKKLERSGYVISAVRGEGFRFEKE